jgi:AcrR family transcriptional regulator
VVKDTEIPQSAAWPNEISMTAFRQAWELEGAPVWETVFEMHKDNMQIKNINVAISNLENIFNTTFRLTDEKGFQAMSLRDLSRETGISMGGLYAYIGSKNDLASVIEAVLRHYILLVLGSLAKHDLDPVSHLKAIIYGENYLNEIMNPWFNFCYMELKGLPREQQEKAMDLELQAQSILADNFKKGIKQGVFRCDDPEMLAVHAVAMQQEWYLKRWKFKRMKVDADQYAESVLAFVLKALNCDLGVNGGAAAGSRLKSAV